MTSMQATDFPNSKSHVHSRLFRSFQTIRLCNISKQAGFRVGQLSAPHPTLTLEDLPLSAVRNWISNRNIP
jgi:hypothetical protein